MDAFSVCEDYTSLNLPVILIHCHPEEVEFSAKAENSQRRIYAICRQRRRSLM
jgi:hypothetical protein